MKTLNILAAIFALIGTAQISSAQEIIKTCKATIQVPGAPDFKNDVMILKGKNGELTSKVIQYGEEGAATYENVASIQDYAIEHDISALANLDEGSDESAESFGKLNVGEKILLLTLKLERSIPGVSKAGIDQTLVRSLRLYGVGEDAVFGKFGVIEAFDAQGSSMGSFLYLLAAAKCE